ncbi:MAG: UDP-N-acetylmuramate dehydrogenase [Limisphaerales bacterium]
MKTSADHGPTRESQLVEAPSEPARDRVNAAMDPAPHASPASHGDPAAVASLADVLGARLSPGSVIRRDEPLARRTTLRVGGRADLLVEPDGESDLAIVLEEARRHAVPWRVLGRGSNLLIRDGGVRGVVISMGRPAFAGISGEGLRLRCGAGVRLKEVSNEARRRGVAGLEFLSGIPGSVGGALRMNAGAWNSTTFEVIETIRCMRPDGGILECAAAEVPVRYRSCDLFRDHVALAAVFVGTRAEPADVEAKLKDLNARRWASQPAAPSAGCIFKNPAAIPAGRLIDELGLKGTRVGGASVSMEHGNFIVNDGTATAADVLALIALIRKRVREERGLEMETEVEILGE